MRPAGGQALRRAARIVLVAAAVACGGSKPLPDYLARGNVDHPKFPRNRYVTGVGISPQSSEDAANQARRAVSERISSQLRSETDSFLSASSSGADQAKITTRLRTSTSFDRADLIDVVERQESEGSWYALGVLDRARADGELGRGTQAELVSFASFTGAARAARQQSRQGDFNTAKTRAMQLLPKLDASFIVRRAVLGRPSSDEAQFLEQRNDLLRMAAEAESHRVVQVRIEGQEAPALMKLAVSAVRKLGLRVAESKTCAQVEDHPEDASELVLMPEETCSEGSLGERCEVAIRLHAKGCTGGGEGEGRTPQLRGVHPSDRNRARTAAWNKVTQETVETAVNEALRGAQVLDEGGSR